jgi:hypothetical protein
MKENWSSLNKLILDTQIHSGMMHSSKQKRKTKCLT